MNYNFDELTNRRGTQCMKWDERQDIPADTIPLWVADMDFKTAPAIIEALRSRVDQGIFGYTYVMSAYYEAVTNWFDRFHGWHIERSQVIYTSGVVPAISAVVKALTRPGEKVLIQTPVYNCFFSSIRNNGCTALESSLVLEGDKYYIDFEDFEAKASDPQCKLMILCNPHNPASRVWTPDELERIDDICYRHGVTIVSDEIHCELVMEGYHYTPFATVAKHDWIVCISPSKAFNTAGLQIANIVCSNQELRAKVDRAINDNEVCDVNPFGVAGLMAAYNDSRDWLEQLLVYIKGNFMLLKDEFSKSLPELPIINLEATYLAWVDCRRIGMSSADLEEYLIKEAHVWLNAGSMYGKDGEGFMRINLACPRPRLAEAIRRLVPVLQNLLRKN